MFSSILSIAIANLGLNHQEAASVRTECPAVQSSSLLTVLDDKNRLIAALQKQLENQKSQLSYYIKRELSGQKIKQLSLSCRPQAFEESLPLDLALAKFCRQAGVKTKLGLLHERMNRLDCKVSNSLNDQEFLLRKIVNKLCDFLRFQESKNCGFKEQFESFINDPFHVDLFDKLLTATIGLRRRLEGFKICCDRLLLVEEERNAVVEQVYALPVDERTNRNFIVEIQMEKARLESELERISKQPATGPLCLKELDDVEDLLEHLKSSFSCTFLQSEESSINRMLKTINTEAKLLLEMSKKQKKGQQEDFTSKGLEPNRILLFINLAASDKLCSEDLERWGIKSEEELSFFELVRDEMGLLKKKIRQELQGTRQERDLIRRKLKQLLQENSRSQMALKALQRELDQLKLEHSKELQAVKEERNLYKAQVEDLEAIREAYAQLVEKPRSKSDLEKLQNKDHTISELKKLLLKQMKQLNNLNTKPNPPALKDSSTSSAKFPNHLKPGKKPRFQIDVKKLRFQRKKLFVTHRNYALVTQSKGIQGDIQLEKSSLFSMEIQLNNSPLGSSRLEIEESELFKNVSGESMAKVFSGLD